MLKSLAIALLGAAAITVAAESQVPSFPPPAMSYADLADLALPAPVVAQVRVTSASRLKPAEAPGLAPGRTRFYVEAGVVTLIQGAGGLPSVVRFLADLPNDAAGRPAKPRKGAEWLVFAHPVPNRSGELRLAGRVDHHPVLAQRVRAVLGEAAQPNAAPRITGIGKAFHAAGTLPGESETQIFLQTSDRRPVSLSILRRPGEAPRWSVSLAEVVDESAAAPARETLLWYRLACTLPPILPPQSVADLSPEEAGAIRNDYAFVMDTLGRCERRQPRAASLNEARSTPTPAQSG
jgi:hypothetical protein